MANLSDFKLVAEQLSHALDLLRAENAAVKAGQVPCHWQKHYRLGAIIVSHMEDFCCNHIQGFVPRNPFESPLSPLANAF